MCECSTCCFLKQKKKNVCFKLSPLQLSKAKGWGLHSSEWALAWFPTGRSTSIPRYSLHTPLIMSSSLWTKSQLSHLLPSNNDQVFPFKFVDISLFIFQMVFPTLLIPNSTGLALNQQLCLGTRVQLSIDQTYLMQVMQELYHQRSVFLLSLLIEVLVNTVTDSDLNPDCSCSMRSLRVIHIFCFCGQWMERPTIWNCFNLFNAAT